MVVEIASSADEQELAVKRHIGGAWWHPYCGARAFSRKGFGSDASCAGDESCQPMGWASATMIPSGPRTYAIRQEPSYSPIPPTNP